MGNLQGKPLITDADLTSELLFAGIGTTGSIRQKLAVAVDRC